MSDAVRDAAADGRDGTPRDPLLTIDALDVHYGHSHILQGVDLAVGHGEVVALFGRNGVGKTTLISTVMGLVEATDGSVRLDGDELLGRAPHEIAARGVSLVPQGRRIFAELTVEENLAIARRTAPAGEWDLDRVFGVLPRLAERRRHRGDQLSGGEQQMLAVGRALLRNPRLMLLDEPSEGLAPRIVDEVGRVLARLRDRDIPALLVEQNLGLGVGLADRVAIMDRGRIAYRADVADFREEPETARRLLGVS